MGETQDLPSIEGRTYLDYGSGFLFLRKKTVEYVYLIEFDNLGNATNQSILSIGTPSRAFVLSEPICSILKSGTHAFGLLHNHPDGSRPSKTDSRANFSTRFLADTYKKLFLNHCVVGKELYYMRDGEPDVFHEFRGRVAV